MTAQIESPTKSANSYKSTPSSRSSVLERARAYTQKIDDETRKRDTSRDRSARSPSAERHNNSNGMSMRERAFASVEKEQAKAMPQPKASPARSLRSKGQQEYGGGENPVVSPELLVDALSGHEDGLLAIAERLMEHYDHGYDAMGEAIIDAFADVQKLFQHVVEAAHMEGAAFEASRREEEARDLGNVENPQYEPEPLSPNGPARHDEFVDQDVKDCLTEAIRKGAALKEAEKYNECYELYELSCQSASSLLPVDSDHRGRLQLSIARAESMSPDRACAILRYAMDDVLRSGMRAHKVPLPDPSKRADVVLSKPQGHPSMNGNAQVIQSSEEALNSLVEELKEIMEAPIYKDTPLQDVSKRFFDALHEAQKQQGRKQQVLEQNLAKLKGDFLLARAEWEEKLTHAQDQARRAGATPKEYTSASSIMEDARSISQNLHSKSLQEDAAASNNSSFRSPNFAKHPKVESVVSMGSALGQHARSLVGSFACGSQMDEHQVANNATQAWRDRRSNNGGNFNGVDRSRYEDGYSNGDGQSFRQSSARRVDV